MPHKIMRKFVHCTKDGRSLITFHFFSVKHQSGLQRNTFLNISYLFSTSKCASNYVISFEIYDGFIVQNILKAGKLSIWPQLSCPYNKNTLMDLPSSVLHCINSAKSSSTTEVAVTNLRPIVSMCEIIIYGPVLAFDFFCSSVSFGRTMSWHKFTSVQK